MKKYYSCEEVAELFGVKKRTVWAWVREKKLSAIKIGRIYRISSEDIEAFEKMAR